MSSTAPRPRKELILELAERHFAEHGFQGGSLSAIAREAGIQNPITKIDILKETPTTAVLDANDGMGMVASHRAMEMAIEKAKKALAFRDA